MRQLCAAGSPLPAEGYDWVYEQLHPELLLNVGSGGTDVCTGIVQGGPLLPVYRGEIAGCPLGVDVATFDHDGRPVVGKLGELVIRKPMPTMPLCFWNDPDGARLPRQLLRGVPRRLASRRLDHLQRARQLRDHRPLRRDAQPRRRAPGHRRVLHRWSRPSPRSPTASSCTSRTHEGGPGELILFVVPAPGVAVDDELRRRIAAALRASLSPRHVPDTVEVVPSIPRTLTAKKLELPVKRILLGAPARMSRAVTPSPTRGALDAFVDDAARRAPRSGTDDDVRGVGANRDRAALERLAWP